MKINKKKIICVIPEEEEAKESRIKILSSFTKSPNILFYQKQP